jgi:hypothetical protein
VPQCTASAPPSTGSYAAQNRIISLFLNGLHGLYFATNGYRSEKKRHRPIVNISASKLKPAATTDTAREFKNDQQQ